ncbi:hypothetical protein AB835_02650 [Candidatus Endobugula sertula]|uniref:Rhodanese domain-containing protein n=1 Tax=Candidatus Endobugula sertula TaxID=62101 RepID=A0A1D2QST0_9GAMM|nr:hypothetical protein AB835_02650 [Candidatus Endobugula sertula]
MKTINIDKLHTLFLDNPESIIDIREKEAFSKEHIPGSKNIPYRLLKTRLNEIPKEENIYVICEKGGLSIGATTLLSLNGVSACCVSPGGVIHWKEKGFPISAS